MEDVVGPETNPEPSEQPPEAGQEQQPAPQEQQGTEGENPQEDMTNYGPSTENNFGLPDIGNFPSM